MGKQDKAVSYTIEYLEILEKVLDFRYLDNGDLFIVNPITTNTLKKLKNKLHSLYKDGYREAISDSRKYGTENVQTVGFGLAKHEDFNKFIKIGLMCGTRLILWDLIEGRILRKTANTLERVHSLAMVASNLLTLKSVAKDGGVVILPHPPLWSREALHQVNELSTKRNPNTSHYGLVTALSVIEEVPIHPYTVFPGKSMTWPNLTIVTKNHNYYPREKYVFHKALNDTLQDIRFAYLKNIGISEFYEVISKDNRISNELLKLFSTPFGVSSPQEINSYYDYIRSSLKKDIDERNNHTVAEYLSKTSAGLTFLTASFTIINSITCSSNDPVGIALMGLSAALFGFLSIAFKKERKSFIVQAFREISNVNRRHIT